MKYVNAWDLIKGDLFALFSVAVVFIVVIFER